MNRTTAWIRADRGLIKVRLAYNPAFNTGAKAIGGRWRPDERVWLFPLDRIAEVEALLRRTTKWRSWPIPAARQVKAA